MSTEVKLPELGENITSGDLVKILVKAGDTIQKDQPIVELETDKATIEVPSPLAGTVKELLVKEGQKLKVGQAILSMEDGNGTGAKAAAEPKQKAAAPPKAEATKPEQETEGKRAAESAAASKSAEPAEAAEQGPESAPAVEEAESAPAKPKEEDSTPISRPSSSAGQEAAPKPGIAQYSATPSRAPVGGRSPADVPAAPSVRQMAREIGVDITEVEGSGPGGRITQQDVKRHARDRNFPSALLLGHGGMGRPIRCSDLFARERSTMGHAPKFTHSVLGGNNFAALGWAHAHRLRRTL